MIHFSKQPRVIIQSKWMDQGAIWTTNVVLYFLAVQMLKADSEDDFDGKSVI